MIPLCTMRSQISARTIRRPNSSRKFNPVAVDPDEPPIGTNPPGELFVTTRFTTVRPCGLATLVMPISSPNLYAAITKAYSSPVAGTVVAFGSSTLVGLDATADRNVFRTAVTISVKRDALAGFIATQVVC